MFGIRDINSKKYKLVNRLAESTITQTNNDEDTPITNFSEINPKPEKEWIWVKGYKGFNEQWVDGKLELTGRNSFIYNQDGETSIREYEDENNLKECETGLHFCTKLVNVFGFYPPTFNRILEGDIYGYTNIIGFYNTVFAEIEAEVEKDYYEKHKYCEKLVARKIRITRILNNEEVFENLEGKYSCDNYNIETFEEFNYIKNTLHEYTVNNPAILESDSLALSRYIGGVAKELRFPATKDNVKVGSKVRMINKEVHKNYPQWFPAVGTVGIVRKLDYINCEVQWPYGTTSWQDKWWCNYEHLEVLLCE